MTKTMTTTTTTTMTMSFFGGRPRWGLRNGRGTMRGRRVSPPLSHARQAPLLFYEVISGCIESFPLQVQGLRGGREFVLLGEKFVGIALLLLEILLRGTRALLELFQTCTTLGPGGIICLA